MPTTPTTDLPVTPEAASTSPPVPTLDEIRLLEPGERKVFRGVDWEFYTRLHDAIGEQPWLRIGFDGRDLEIMPTSPLHEDVGRFASRLVEVVCEELVIPWRSLGSTTWERPAIRRGIEADDCFFFAPEKLAAIGAAVARRSKDVADYPNPDLAIEVDLSEPKIDRPGIYAALRVPEIWRFTEARAIIERLTDQGSYAEAGEGGFLPIRTEEVARWVFLEDTGDVGDWKRRLRAWVRAELAGRRAP